MPPPGRFKRAVSSGRLDCDRTGRKILSYQNGNMLDLAVDRPEDEVASDDDKNNIEMIHDREPSFDIPQIKAINTSDIGDRPEDTAGDETLVESFVLPGADGFSLDFIHKNRTGDNIRRNFLSKLTYQKVWLSPMQ